MNTDQTIDRFAQLLKSSGVDLWDLAEAPWIDKLQARLPQRLPVSFRSFVARYGFGCFEVGPLLIFGNRGVSSEYELSDVVFCDRALYPTLLASGQLQFGRPAGGSYDPVCFDATRRSKIGEHPIVQIDHEEVLCNSKIVVRTEIARSFFHFVNAVLEEGPSGIRPLT